MKINHIKLSNFWESLYECMGSNLKYDPNQIIFKDLFEKYLKRGGSCLEIGCYPGNFLIYFSKEFDYDVSGIDIITSQMMKETRDHLQANGVTASELLCQDFMEYKPLKLYDLVCSFGFVEHFPNYEEIIIKHISMVKPGGTLIITCPNFWGLQYLAHLLFDRECLSSHVISSMNLRKWRRILKSNNMRLIYHNYYKTAGFVRGPDTPKTRYHRVSQRAFSNFCEMIEDNVSYPNPLLSPYMISISEKIKP